MIRAFLWKEWREQRTVAIAVLLFGALAMVLAAQFAEPGGTTIGPREAMPAAIAYLAGAVCGAILLADEKEVGTIEFLDSLPTRRRNLWFGKVVFGLVLVLVESAIVGGLSIALGMTDARLPLPVQFGALVMVGVVALSWGLFGGAMSRSVLGAVFQGSVFLIPATFAAAVPFAIIFANRAFVRPFPILQGLTYALMVAGIGLASSFLVFTLPDRARNIYLAATSRRTGEKQRFEPRRKRLMSLRALTWLSARQSLWITIGAFCAGLCAGASLLAPEAQPVFAWPMLTMGLGALAGVTILGEEQTKGVAQFWAERRLPLGRLWAVKVMFHFAIAAGAGVMLILPLMVASSTNPFRTSLLMYLRPELGRFIWLGLVYGFVVGHLASMAFKKTVVAGMVAVVLSATFVGLLIPSVVCGGASTWQIWGPAVVLLLTGRLLLYPWATNRTLHRGPALRAIGGVALAMMVLAGGLVYRVVELPLVADRPAESGMEGRIMAYDVDMGRRLARSAVSQYRTAAVNSSSLLPKQNQATPGSAGSGGTQRLIRVAQSDWGPESELMVPWLNQVFAGEWPRLLDELPDKELGTFEDPRNLDYASTAILEDASGVRDLLAALRVRGIQRLHDGDPAEFPRLLRGGLAVARFARHLGGNEITRASFMGEEFLLRGVMEWANDPQVTPALLRSAMSELERHQREMPRGIEDSILAENLILRSTMERIGNWLPQILSRHRSTAAASSAVGDPAEQEAQFVSFAWSVPWERARRERAVRLSAHRDRPFDVSWLSTLHYSSAWRPERNSPIPLTEPQSEALGSFARTTIAIRLFRADKGRPPATLDELVPTYLSSVPPDPYGDGKMRYRVSTGELVRRSSGTLPGSVPIHLLEWMSLMTFPQSALPGAYAMYQIPESTVPILPALAVDRAPGVNTVRPEKAYIVPGTIVLAISTPRVRGRNAVIVDEEWIVTMVGTNR